LLGHSYTGLKPPATAKLDIAFLSDIPVLGRILFNHDAVVYFSIIMVFAIWWFLNRSRAGLVLRAVGENHDAAHSLGYNVVLIRMLAIMFGGAMAGLGGAYFSLIRVPQWTEGMTAGAGWIALALVVFASWKPGRLLIGAYLFGGISVLEINLQIAGAGISPAYLKMTPYLVTIIVLVIMSSDRRRASLNAPASLGRSFHASH
jgi:ABC-type uncharacterized transport system permease subunit